MLKPKANRHFKTAILWLALAAGATEAVAAASGDAVVSDKDKDKDKDRDKWKIHAYLTQAYAFTDGREILGITEGGTTDYRNLALQLRYHVSDDNAFVVQLSHERQGVTAAQELQDDVEVDWAFYHHRFSDDSSFKVGRVPLPIGIYNEIRDVGALLPFYAPPFSVYQETSFTSETIDGVVFTQTLFPLSSWRLEVDVYGGGWNTLESIDGDRAPARANDAFGAQLWLDTPLRGLRIGAGANRFDLTGGVLRIDPDGDEWKAYYLSLDVSRDRFTVRSEYYRREIRVLVLGIPLPDLTTESYYLQTGVRLTEKLWLNAQFERLDLDPKLATLPGVTARLWDDWVIGLTYELGAGLTLKAEYHDNEGFFGGDRSSNFLLDDPAPTKYSIVSFSAAF